eukprot:36976_1
MQTTNIGETEGYQSPSNAILYEANIRGIPPAYSPEYVQNNAIPSAPRLPQYIQNNAIPSAPQYIQNNTIPSVPPPPVPISVLGQINSSPYAPNYNQPNPIIQPEPGASNNMLNYVYPVVEPEAQLP